MKLKNLLGLPKALTTEEVLGALDQNKWRSPRYVLEHIHNNRLEHNEVGLIGKYIGDVRLAVFPILRKLARGRFALEITIDRLDFLDLESQTDDESISTPELIQERIRFRGGRIFWLYKLGPQHPK